MLALLAALAAACGSRAVLPPSERLARQAASLIPPDGKANVYVIRGERHLADRALWRIDLDVRGFGTLEAESYLYGWVSPGDHVLAVLEDGRVSGRLRFTARAGRNYFFMVVPGLLALHLARVEEREGRGLIERYALSGDNRFEAEGLPRGAAARDGG